MQIICYFPDIKLKSLQRFVDQFAQNGFHLKVLVGKTQGEIPLSRFFSEQKIGLPLPGVSGYYIDDAVLSQSSTFYDFAGRSNRHLAESSPLFKMICQLSDWNDDSTHSGRFLTSKIITNVCSILVSSYSFDGDVINNSTLALGANPQYYQFKKQILAQFRCATDLEEELFPINEMLQAGLVDPKILFDEICQLIRDQLNDHIKCEEDENHNF